MKKTTIHAALLSQLCFLLLLPFIIDLFQYLHPIVYVVVWLCLTVLIFFLIYLFRKEHIVMSRRIVIGALIVYTICLLMLLFMRPGNQSYDSYNLVPFETVSFYLSGEVAPLVAIYNLAANIGLFIPYGTAFLLLSKKRPSTVVLLAVPVAGIAIIEVTQWLTGRGSLDIDDLLLNVVGVAIGYALTPLVRRVMTFY
ncbi:MAG: VanZ family protein [Bacillus sp. (in: firmicutes)]